MFRRRKFRLDEELALIALARQRDALLEAAKGLQFVKYRKYEIYGGESMEVAMGDLEALRAAIRSCEGE